VAAAFVAAVCALNLAIFIGYSQPTSIELLIQQRLPQLRQCEAQKIAVNVYNYAVENNASRQIRPNLMQSASSAADDWARLGL
jgi:hypothetical protein